MKILLGKPVAEKILALVKERIKKAQYRPVFVAFLVGSDEASALYVSLKEKIARSIGIDFRVERFPDALSEEALLSAIHTVNDDDAVDGILVQLPLPSSLDVDRIVSAIDPKKDVDGFHPETVRRFLQGDDKVFSPVFPHAIAELVQSAGVSLAGKHAVVIGNSDIFGQMMLATLERIGVTGEFVQRKTLLCTRAKVLSADIVITACGVANLITSDMIKDGAVVIDGGIVKVGDKFVGDVDILSMQSKDVFVSPVPGGVGPVTIACLLENVHRASMM
jgi:methylenetetrahydrofolate dehydrogenase (NADP+)/methenyltetrahydrofolate cyclohydrolase